MTTRLPTNALNNLDDMKPLLYRAVMEWIEVYEHAKRNNDLITMALLAKQRDTLSELETKRRNARQNIYE